MAGRKPGAGRKPAKNETAAGLLNALKFLSVTKSPTATSLAYVSHVFLNEGWAIAFDGIIAAGHPIDAGINGYPHTKLLTEALENCGKQFTLTVQDSGAFEIVSETKTYLVPSLDYGQVVPTLPDPMIAPLNKAFVTAMDLASKVTADAAQAMEHASLYMNGATIYGTNGAVFIEAWHGNNMPIGMVMPKALATALVKCGKEPVGFGLSPSWDTLTIYFGDHSWIRSQTYAQVWSAGILEKVPGFFPSTAGAELPKGLFEAVKMVAPFADEDDRIIIRPGLIRTHADRRHGASLEIPSVMFSIDIASKNLLALETMLIKDAPPASFQIFEGRFVFATNLLRAVIAGKQPLPEPEPAPVAPAAGGWTTAPAVSPQVPDAAPWGAPPHPATGQVEVAIARASPPVVATGASWATTPPLQGYAPVPEQQPAPVIPSAANPEGLSFGSWLANLELDEGDTGNDLGNDDN